MSYEVGGGGGGGYNTIRPGTLVEVGLNRLCSRSCQHMRDDWIQQFILVSHSDTPLLLMV